MQAPNPPSTNLGSNSFSPKTQFCNQLSHHQYNRQHRFHRYQKCQVQVQVQVPVQRGEEGEEQEEEQEEVEEEVEEVAEEAEEEEGQGEGGDRRSQMMTT